MRLAHSTLGICFALLFSANGAAQPYPGKPIRIIVPGAPGGATDLLGRIVGPKLSERMGQPVVVENRPGAGGGIAAELVARAPADGHSLMIGGILHAINMSLIKHAGYDLANDFAAISNLVRYPSMIAVHPSLPVSSMKQLIALARSNPGGLNFGSNPGSPNHLAMELINVMAGVKMTFIGYKSTAPVLIDLIGGHLQVSCIGFPGAIRHVNAGRLRPVAVTTAKRSALLPALPTVAESGLAGFDMSSWYGVFGQARLPADTIMRFNSEFRIAMKAEEVRAKLSALGAEADTNSPAEYSQLVRSEIERWERVVKASGAKAD